MELPRLAARKLGSVLPVGSGPVSVGLAVAGVTAYGFLILTGRVLGPADYASLSSLWFVGFLVGSGVFLPLEQELAAALASRREAGVGGGPLARRAAAAGATVAAALAAMAVAGNRPLLDRLFDDDVLLLVSLCLLLTGYFVEHFCRGVLAGTTAFRPYGVVLGAEGVLRLGGCAVLAAAGVTRPGPYGLAVALAPFAASALAAAALRPVRDPGPPAPWHELSTNLAVLVVAMLFSQGLANAAPITAKVLAHDDAARVGAFQAGVVLTRTPLYMFAAVQAALLPMLSAMIARGDIDGSRKRVRNVLAGVAAIGAAATAGAYIVGPFVLRLLFGADFRLDRRSLALLALASAGHMACLALTQALVALRRHAAAARGWAAGVAIFVAVVALWTAQPHRDVLLGVELAFLVGEATAAAVLAAAAFRPPTRLWRR